MTKKHYFQLVDVICWNDLDDAVVSDLVSVLKSDNSSFCKQTFYDAIVKKRKEIAWENQ